MFKSLCIMIQLFDDSFCIITNSGNQTNLKEWGESVENQCSKFGIIVHLGSKTLREKN